MTYPEFLKALAARCLSDHGYLIPKFNNYNWRDEYDNCVLPNDAYENFEELVNSNTI